MNDICVKAVFIGWLGNKEYGTDALFNIIGGENDGSTVGVDTLFEMNVRVPEHPSFNAWTQNRKLVA